MRPYLNRFFVFLMVSALAQPTLAQSEAVTATASHEAGGSVENQSSYDSGSSDVDGGATEPAPAGLTFSKRWSGFWRANGTPIIITVAIVGTALLAHRVDWRRVAKTRGAPSERPRPTPVIEEPPFPTPEPPAMGEELSTSEIEHPYGSELAPEPTPSKTSVPTIAIEDRSRMERGVETPETSEPPSLEYKPIHDFFPILRDKFIDVVDPITRESVLVRVADLTLPSAMVAQDRHLLKVLGQTYVFMHDPVDRHGVRELALARLAPEAQAPSASAGSYFDTHAFDPRLLLIEEPYAHLFPRGLREHVLSRFRRAMRRTP